MAYGEIALGRSVFGDGVEWGRVRVLREKFVFFQPRTVTMAPDGNVWFHPAGRLAMSPLAEDFSKGDQNVRAHFVHELTHVWQHQCGVNLVLEKLIMFFRYGALGGYGYELEEGRGFSNYNIEQQACMVADACVARWRGEEDCELEKLLPFPLSERGELG